MVPGSRQMVCMCACRARWGSNQWTLLMCSCVVSTIGNCCNLQSIASIVNKCCHAPQIKLLKSCLWLTLMDLTCQSQCGHMCAQNSIRVARSRKKQQQESVTKNKPGNPPENAKQSWQKQRMGSHSFYHRLSGSIDSFGILTNRFH